MTLDPRDCRVSAQNADLAVIRDLRARDLPKILAQPRRDSGGAWERLGNLRRWGSVIMKLGLKVCIYMKNAVRIHLDTSWGLKPQ